MIDYPADCPAIPRLVPVEVGRIESRQGGQMTGIVLSTLAFFVASFFIRRYLDEIGVSKTMTRSLVVFILALAVAYVVAFITDWAAGLIV
jgi:hypothetical protein